MKPAFYINFFLHFLLNNFPLKFLYFIFGTLFSNMLFVIHTAVCTVIKLQLLGSIAVLIILKAKIDVDERNLIDLAAIQCQLRTDVYSEWLSNLISVV